MSEVLVAITSLAYHPADSREGAILRDVNFAMRERDKLAIVGANGSGKTTLLRLISGDRWIGGNVFGHIACSDRLTCRPGAIGFVRQRPALFPWLRVRENVAFGFTPNGDGITIEQKTNEQLRRFGCDALERRFPYQLSGGETQRVALAQTLATNPALLLLDEPFSAMDVRNKTAMIGLLAQLSHDHGFGVILVSHDYRDVIKFADRVLVLVRSTGGSSIFKEFSIPAGQRDDPSFMKEMLWALSEAADTPHD